MGEIKSIDVTLSLILIFFGIIYCIGPDFSILGKLTGSVFIFNGLLNILTSLPQKQYNRWFWMLFIPVSLSLYNSLYFIIIDVPTLTNYTLWDYVNISVCAICFGYGIYGIILTLKNFKKIVHQ